MPTSRPVLAPAICRLAATTAATFGRRTPPRQAKPRVGLAISALLFAVSLIGFWLLLYGLIRESGHA